MGRAQPGSPSAGSRRAVWFAPACCGVVSLRRRFVLGLAHVAWTIERSVRRRLHRSRARRSPSEEHAMGDLSRRALFRSAGIGAAATLTPALLQSCDTAQTDRSTPARGAQSAAKTA